MEDQEVVRRIKGGDTEAFSVLVEKYHERLLSFIFRLVRDERIVEDIGQEVFLNVYKSLPTFDENRGTPFAAWLFIVARNHCISELRKRNGNTFAAVSIEEIGELADNYQSTESLFMEQERREALRISLEKLAKPFKEPFLMSLRGYSLMEIAKACNISPGTVKSRLFRAKEKMKSLVKGYLGGNGYGEV